MSEHHDPAAATVPLPLPVGRAGGQPTLTAFGFYSRAEHALDHALDLAALKLVDEGAARVLASDYADRLLDTLDPHYDRSDDE